MNLPTFGWSNKRGRTVSHATALGWERGAEPGFLAGCAIAHLGGLPAEALAFKQAGGEIPAAPFPRLKGTPNTTVASRKGGKRA